MNCEKMKNCFSAYIDGELDAGDTALVDGHLKECSACEREFSDFKNDMRLVPAAINSGLPDMQKLSDRIVSAAMTGTPIPRAYPPVSTPRKLLQYSLLSSAAGFLVAFVLFTWLMPRRPYDTMTPQPANTVTRNVTEPAAETQPTQKVSFISGRMEYKTIGTDWAVCPTDEELPANSFLRTPENSKAIISLGDKTELCVNQLTSMQLSGANSAFIETGELLINVKTDTACPFMLKSHIGTFTTSDADAHFIVSEQGTFISAFDGMIRFCPADSPDGQVDVGAGSQTMFHANRHISQTSLLHYPAYRNILWTAELLYSKSPDNPQLTAIIRRIIEKLSSGHMQYMAENDLRSVGRYASPALMEYVSSNESGQSPEIRSNAARILADIGDNAAIRTWISLLENQQPDIRYYAAKGLYRVTGEDFGINLDFWLSPEPAKHAEAVDYWKEWLMLKRE